MITKEMVLEKKARYEGLKNSLATEDFMPEIDKKVEEFRISLIKEKELEIQSDLNKLDCYIAALDSLLKEEEIKENEEVIETDSKQGE